MNSRARNRLIGISAILIILIGAALVYFFNFGAAHNLTVSEIYGNEEFIGKTIKVSGVVVGGSWDKNTNPMTFKLADVDDDGTGPQISIVYSGQIPATFGDGVEAIITGELQAGNIVKSNDMITKCPSKYESSDDAYGVAQLREKQDTMVDIPVRVSGVIKAGSIVPPGGAVRFVMVDKDDPSVELNVRFDEGIPEEISDGSTVVVTGELDTNHAFNATVVALEK